MNALWLLFVFGVVGLIIGQSKGRPIEGLIYSLLVGPFGWLILLFGKDYSKKQEHGSVAIKVENRPPPKQLRVAKDGNDLGNMDVPSVILSIKTGRLTENDFYFNPHMDDWFPLSGCAELRNFWKSRAV